VNAPGRARFGRGGQSSAGFAAASSWSSPVQSCADPLNASRPPGPAVPGLWLVCPAPLVSPTSPRLPGLASAELIQPRLNHFAALAAQRFQWAAVGSTVAKQGGCVLPWPSLTCGRASRRPQWGAQHRFLPSGGEQRAPEPWRARQTQAELAGARLGFRQPFAAAPPENRCGAPRCCTQQWAGGQSTATPSWPDRPGQRSAPTATFAALDGARAAPGRSAATGRQASSASRPAGL